ncbi:FtsX-like permease family protein [Peptostreptococcus stomatis]|uniref:ABC transporter permease n=1 Tax=Peptostreptococcus stomatis TaxID=341694 RepID=UPI003991A0A9
MKITNELLNSQIKNNKKDTLATRLSIFLAVVLLGTIIFIIGTIKADQYNLILSTVGDYNVSFTQVDGNMLKSIMDNDEIKRVSFDKLISTDLDATIIEKGAYYKDLEGYEILSGKRPNSSDELIVPRRFLQKYKKYKLGSKLKVKGKEYTIVGEYNDYAKSFEESALIGVLDESNKENLLKNTDGIEAYVWYKKPRDTYTLTKKIFDEFKINYDKALETGRLYFNRDILEYKMIYPSGLIPPKHVIADMIESYGACLVLVLLFAVMIYGAFNVWNNRDIKELALLKSVGMTEKQIKKMIRFKAIKIGLVPIFAGTLVSYLTANLLLYLMWFNNYISYKNMSSIIGEDMRTTEFHIIHLSFSTVCIILFLAFLTVYLSAIIPARKSARLNVIEGLTEITGMKIKYGKSKISGKVEKTLARDYFKAYESTYRTIILAILLSAMVMTLVLVSQSYRTIDETYGKYKNPYNFKSNILTNTNLSKDLLKEIHGLKGVDELHIYWDKSFKFYLEDNKGFESEDLKKAFEIGGKEKDNLYVNIIGLHGKDFDKVVSMNKLDRGLNYILLNRTPDNNKTPYTFRNYIKLTNNDEKNLVLRYNIDGKPMSVHVDGYIDKFPFDLKGQEARGSYLFTRMENLESFVEKYGQDSGDPTNSYIIKMKIKKNLARVSDSCEKIISSYISKSDHSTTNEILNQASKREQTRNEHMLNLGIQIILVLLALSNAYNSFHGNLRARKREFQLLSTAGMTEKQIKKLIYGEIKILFKYATVFYVLMFVLAVCVRSYRSNYDFAFVSKAILLNINYIPIILVFCVIVAGILIAIRSGIRDILDDDLNNMIRGF